MKPILEIKQISKKFHLGQEFQSYLSLRESVNNLFKRRNNNTADFWALKDVSFDVYPGDSLAIIGSNGAGKTTLLKILSKITPPTKGKIICRGRIASLLEVGTGFHPELTGKENVFLNGSILGLKRREIKEKFDEIVDFSGVEKFLDTPLKRYSSGMQLRLAFSVAAHLEPEILMIDEVLAVGDSVFQQKCIEKMSEISSSGRTILFVSHNFSAVKNLCKRAILLEDGSLTIDSKVDEVLNCYINKNLTEFKSEIDLENLQRPEHKGEIIFSKIKFNKTKYYPDDEFELKINLTAKQGNVNYKNLLFGINIYNTNNECLYHLSNIFKKTKHIDHHINNTYIFRINQLALKPGNYTISLFLKANEEIQDWIRNKISLKVEQGNVYHYPNSEMIQGAIQPLFDFKVTEN